MVSRSIEDVTVGVNVFMRSSKLEKCLDAIEGLERHPENVIVADDSFDKTSNREICGRNYGFDLTYIELPYDSGASRSRNRIVQETSTEFLMLLDEDQYLKKGVIEYLRSLLMEEQGLAGIAPSWIENGVKITDGRDIKFESGWVVADRFKDSEKKESKGKTFFEYDFVATSCLYRLEALRDIGWDENYIIGGEHLDFFLTYKLNSSWKFAVTEDKTIIHDSGSSLQSYMSHRRSSEKLGQSRRYFQSKWCVKGFLFREKHGENYQNYLSALITGLFYRLPNRVHWVLKGSNGFEFLKRKYSEVTGDEFR